MKSVVSKILIIFAFLSLLSFSKAFAQCDLKCQEVFKSVTKEADREVILKNYNQFITSYSNHNFEEVYKLLSNNYLRSSNLKNEQDFVSMKKLYYTDLKIKFISFTPESVSESVDADYWIVRGCLKEKEGWRKKKREANIHIWKDKGKFLFSDIEWVTSIDFETVKCK